MPKTVIHAINKIIFPFVWRKKCEWMARTSVTQPLSQGGLGIVDVSRKVSQEPSKSHLGKGKLIAVEGRLQQEITHWLFLEHFNDPLPWHDECHVRISLATDASNSGWGGQLLSPGRQAVSDYWAPHESNWDIATKEAVAIEKVLQTFHQHILNAVLM